MLPAIGSPTPPVTLPMLPRVMVLWISAAVAVSTTGDKKGRQREQDDSPKRSRGGTPYELGHRSCNPISAVLRKFRHSPYSLALTARPLTSISILTLRCILIISPASAHTARRLFSGAPFSLLLPSVIRSTPHARHHHFSGVPIRPRLLLPAVPHLPRRVTRFSRIHSSTFSSRDFFSA